MGRLKSKWEKVLSKKKISKIDRKKSKVYQCLNTSQQWLILQATSYIIACDKRVLQSLFSHSRVTFLSSLNRW